MELNTLKVVAGDIVTQSEVSKSGKLQLLNWLQNEATEPQVKAFLMDGEIVHLDEQSEEIVNARFESHLLNEGGWKTIAGFFLLGPYGWAIYRAVRAAVSEKSKKCGVLAIGRERDVCLWKLRAEENIKLAAMYAKEMKNCAQSKKPDKCKAVGQKKIATHKAKAAKYAAKIKNFSMKSPKKAGKAEAGLKKAADPKTKTW